MMPETDTVNLTETTLQQECLSKCQEEDKSDKDVFFRKIF